MIHWKCPKCEEDLEAPTNLIGTIIRCPLCTEDSIVPTNQSRSIATVNQKIKYVNGMMSVRFSAPLKCPQCHGDSVQKFSMVNASGTKRSNSFMGGFVGGESAGGFGVSQSSTGLADMCAPPQPPGSIGILFFGIIAGFFVLTAIGGLLQGGSQAMVAPVMLIPAGIFALPWWACLKSRRKAMQQYNQNLAFWGKSYICHKCACQFIVEP